MDIPPVQSVYELPGRIVPDTPRERRWFVAVVVIAIFFFMLDWGTKELAVRNIAEGRGIEVIPGFFNLVHVLNYGSAFGMFYGQGTMLLIISAVALLAIVIFFRRWAEGCPERFIAFGLIISGIFGNALDRLIRDPAAVVDFLDFYIGTAHWPAFNVADSAICVGAVLFIISSFKRISPEDIAKQLKKTDAAEVEPVTSTEDPAS